MSAPDPRPRRAVVLGFVLLAALATGGAASRRAAVPAAVPEGEGRAIAERACLICHSAMLLNQQSKDRAAWTRSIAQMQKWGAPLDSLESDTLAVWLARVRGPRPR